MCIRDSLKAFLTSLEYPPSTSTIILNCVTRYSGYLCMSFQRNGPYFVVFSASFSSLFSTQGQLISITDTFLFSLSTMVASIPFAFTCVFSAYRGMSQYAIALSFSYIGFSWVFENHGTYDVTRSSALITSKNKILKSVVVTWQIQRLG